MKPIAEIDDLITIKGYGERIFRVDVISESKITERDESYDEVLYDCHCVTTAEYMLAEQEDVEIVRKAADADGFLRTYKAPYMPKPAGFTLFGGMPTFNMTEVYDMQKRAAEVKPKEPTKQERIDALLDERRTVGTTDDFVKVADIETYRQRTYDAIDAQLKELTAE